MSNTPNLCIAFQNLGPIGAGTIEFKPLTILIGPNNSGKSYAAQSAYALWRAVSGSLRRPFTTTEPFTEFLDRQLRDADDRVGFTKLPDERQAILKEDFDRYLERLRSDLVESLRRYLGVEDTSDLMRVANSRQPLSIQVSGTQRPDLLVELRASPDGDSTTWAALDVGAVTVPVDPGPTLSPLSDDPFARELIVRHLWSQMLTATGFPSGDAYYLPSARSGILTGLEFYTTMAMQLVWQGGGGQPLVLPAFSGVSGDFLQLVAARFSPFATLPPSHERLQPAVELLETKILGGRIGVSQDATRRLSITFETSGLRLPLHRTSSMVAELAPVALYLKHVLQPGDWLIVDEPEAHLHPENQRLIARLLVRMVRAGVRVVCPTHSSLILHQISNCILASHATGESPRELGLTEEDAIDMADVGVYLFEPGRDGTRVKPVPIEPDYGISEDEFLRVAESIGEETYRLTVDLDAQLVGAR